MDELGLERVGAEHGGRDPYCRQRLQLHQRPQVRAPGVALRHCRSGALEGWRGPDKGDFEWQPLWPTLLILKADTCLPSLASFSHLPCPTSGKGRCCALFVPISLFVTLRGSRGADLAARHKPSRDREGMHRPQGAQERQFKSCL